METIYSEYIEKIPINTFISRWLKKHGDYIRIYVKNNQMTLFRPVTTKTKAGNVISYEIAECEVKGKNIEYIFHLHYFECDNFMNMVFVYSKLKKSELRMYFYPNNECEMLLKKDLNQETLIIEVFDTKEHQIKTIFNTTRVFEYDSQRISRDYQEPPIPTAVESI